jgi:N-carbamoyl-L-amino-acid hydrolase
VSRVAYSDADVAGRAYVMKLMEGAGLKPRIDAAWQHLRTAGRDGGIPCPRCSSARTSIPSQRRQFDGDLGTLGAIEVV